MDITYPMVLDKLGIPYNVRGVNVLINCPACGRKKFYFDVKKNVGHCYRASCGLKGTALDIYASVRGLDTKAAFKELASDVDVNYTPPKFDFKEPAPTAPSDVRDKAYRKLLKLSPLSNRHRKDLEKRGIKAGDIDKMGYGSTCTYDLVATTGKILKVMDDHTLKGVAGFYKKDGNWTLNQWVQGILVPYVNQHKEITGFQIRKNNEDIKSKDEGKYTCLTSNGKEDGAKCQLCVHFACDFKQDFCTGQYFPILGNAVRITEGAMKADISHYVTGEPILAVAGINNLESSGFKDVLSYLKKRGVKTIIDTFDMDFKSNEDVQKAMEKLKELVLAADLRYERIDWNSDYKGYDDYVIARRDGLVDKEE